MNTYVTSMKMFHEERTSKNVITPPHPPPTPRNPPNQHPAYEHLCHVNEDVPSMKNALTPPNQHPARTLSHTYVTWTKMFHEERTSKNVITPPHPPPKPPQPTPSVWTPMSRQWRWSTKNALARTLSHPPHPSTLGLYFWLLKRSFFGCWLGPFLVADSVLSWLLTRTLLVADSVLSWLLTRSGRSWLLTRSFLGCWLGRSWLLTRSVADSAALVADSWLLTRLFVVADSVGFSCWLVVADSVGCRLGQCSYLRPGGRYES